MDYNKTLNIKHYCVCILLFVLTDLVYGKTKYVIINNRTVFKIIYYCVPIRDVAFIDNITFVHNINYMYGELNNLVLKVNI